MENGVLEKYFQDSEHNITRFLIMSNDLNILDPHINKLMTKLRTLKFVTSCSRIINDTKTINEKTNFYR